MKNYKDKVIWITGSSSGLGEALATELAKQGAKIILSGRDTNALSAVQAKIKDSKTVAFDMGDEGILKEKVQEAIQVFGYIDMVIHNAGVAQSSTVLDIEDKVEQRILQIDLWSPIQITKYLLPHFLERKQGYISVVSGLLAFINLPGRSAYAAAKAALNAYFGCLRSEVKALNINVSVLIPGSLSTDLANKALKNDGTIIADKKEVKGYPLSKAAKKIAKSILIGKFQIYVG